MSQRVIVRFFAYLACVMAVLLLSCSSEAPEAPSGGKGMVTLTWTATGDDDTVGRAQLYDLRISEDSSKLADNFDRAAKIGSVPAPAEAGLAESHTVAGLQPGTVYYFAIKAGDEAGNWSEVSNIAAETAEIPAEVQSVNH